MNENESVLKEVVIQSILGDQKAKGIIEDIKRRAAKAEAIRYIKESESVDIIVLLEKLVGKVMTEETKEIVKEYIFGSSKEKSHSAGNTAALK